MKNCDSLDISNSQVEFSVFCIENVAEELCDEYKVNH